MTKKAVAADRERAVARGERQEVRSTSAKTGRAARPAAASAKPTRAVSKTTSVKVPAGHRVVATDAKTGKVLTKPITDTAVQRPESKKVQATKAKLKIPKKIGQVADLYYNTRQARLELDHQSQDKKAEETVLKNHLIDTLPKDESTGAAGKVARVGLYEADDYRVTDWDTFYKHLKKTGHFDLLNRALNQSAVAERYAQGKTVPGVEKFKITKVSINKL